MALENIQHSAVDFHGLQQLKQYASGDSQQAALREVASQFESLFIHMMLKSMREAKLGEGLFDSSHTDLYREMADQQLAMDWARRGGLGLQPVILQQLGGSAEAPSVLAEQSRALPMDTVARRDRLQTLSQELLEQVQAVRAEQKAARAAARSADSDTSEPHPRVDRARSAARTEARLHFDSPSSFVEHLWPMAEQAAAKIGVAPEVIISQAALETGWGKHMLRHPDGSPSYNLFNIKVGSSWQGDAVALNALEYRNGKRTYEQSQFRAYASYQESFDDYVTFLQTQPRYQGALAVHHNPRAFVEALHRAGYATDPQYASKILRIMQGENVAGVSAHAHNTRTAQLNQEP